MWFFPDVVVDEELDMLHILADFLFKTIGLKCPICQLCTDHKHQRGQTLIRSFDSITHSLMATADECLIDVIDAVIRKSYPSLPSRIPIRISLMNSNSADNKSRFWNCSSMIWLMAKGW